jgi:hypothetical protein
MNKELFKKNKSVTTHNFILLLISARYYVTIKNNTKMVP